MTDRTSSVTLQWNTDNASLQKIKQAVTDIQGRLKTLNAEGTKGSATFKRYTEVLTVIGRNQAIEDVTKDFVRLSKITNDNVSTLRDLRASLKEIGASESEINKATRAFKEMQAAADGAKGKIDVGKLESRVGRAGASLTGLGLGGVGGAVSGVADVLQLIEIMQGVGPVATVASGGFAGITAALTPLLPIVLPLAVAIGAVALALDNFNKSVAAGKQQLEAGLATQKTFYEFAIDGTTEQAKEEVERLYKVRNAQIDARDETERLIKALEQQTGVSRDVGAALPGALGDPFRMLLDQLKENNKELDTTNILIGRFEGGIQSLAFAMNDAAEAAEKAAAAEKFYHDTVVANQEARRQEVAKQLEEQKAFEEKQRSDIANTVKQYNDQVTAIEEESARIRASIVQRYTDKLVEIADQAAVAAENALKKLESRKADLERELLRDGEKEQRQQEFDDLKVRIDIQRKETQHLREHHRKLDDIRRSFYMREQQALFKRDFLSLYELQQEKQFEMANANQDFIRSQEDAAESIRQMAEDTARQREFERKERLIAYQLQLEDAQRQYEAELIQADQARRIAIQKAREAQVREINDLVEASGQKLKLLRNTVVKELEYLSLGYSARLKLDNQFVNRMIAQAAQLYAGVPGVTQPTVAQTGVFTNSSDAGGVQFFAEGGTLQRGRFGVVQELNGLRETADGQSFPAGAALIQALKPLNIRPQNGGAGGINITQQFMIQGGGSDAQSLIRTLLPAVRSETLKTMRQVMR